MTILIADDDSVSRRLLEITLKKWGYEVVATEDGAAAWHILQKPDAPRLAILDWMMPELDGLELCRRVKTLASSQPPYLILLTAKDDKADIVAGLDGGADDYITKPFDLDELRARVKVGLQIVQMQRRLTDQVQELAEALGRVKQLQSLLPICSYCRKVRDDQNYWQQLETYFTLHAEARFSHGICPECYESVVKPELARQCDIGLGSSF